MYFWDLLGHSLNGWGSVRNQHHIFCLGLIGYRQGAGKRSGLGTVPRLYGRACGEISTAAVNTVKA